MTYTVLTLESPADPLESEESLDAFLQGFETGAWPHSAWTHTSHIIMAGCYLLAYSEAEATERIRQGIRRYNESEGNVNTADSGYHETLTIFWIQTIRAWLVEQPAGRSRLDVIRRLAEKFGPRRDLYKDYYSFDVLRSREARAQWIAPDRVRSSER
jgi:hypothetical protein